MTINGWFAVARISCSVRARLIFFRSIISAFERTVLTMRKRSNRQKRRSGSVTFHSEKLSRLLLPDEIYFPDITATEHFNLLEARRAHLHGSHLDRVARIRPPEGDSSGCFMTQTGACHPFLAPCRSENNTGPNAVHPSRLGSIPTCRSVLHQRTMVR